MKEDRSLQNLQIENSLLQNMFVLSVSFVFVHSYEHVSSVCGNAEDKMEGAVFVAMRYQDFLPFLAKQKLTGYSSCSCVPHCFDFVFSE